MKKGEVSWLMLIVTVAVLVVIISFVPSFASELKQKGYRSTCNTWVATQSSTIFSSFTDSKDDSCVTVAFDLDINNNEKLYSKLAGDMLDCWKDYGEGKIDFYSNWGWGLDDVHCRVCAQGNLEKEYNLNLKEFQDYLNKNKPKLVNKTYSAIFSDVANPHVYTGPDTIKLSDENPLYVAFIVAKGKFKLLNYLGSGVVLGARAGPYGAVAGAVYGGTLYFTSENENFSPGIAIIDAETAKVACTDLYYNLEGKSPIGFSEVGNKLAQGYHFSKSTQ